MACQEASILSRQNASIMPRQTRIGKFTSRNHPDGLSRSRCVSTGRVIVAGGALGVLRRSRRRAIPPTLAVEPDHDQRNVSPRPMSRSRRASTGRDQHRRRVPRARWRNRRREVRRVADRCPVLRWTPARRRSGGLRRQSSYPLPCIMPIAPSWRPILQINKVHANGRLQEWPNACAICEPACWRPKQRLGSCGHR